MSNKGWIPTGSTIQENPNQTLLITPLAGWVYVGTIENTQNVFIVAGGQTKVSCTCNTSGSCLPFTGTGPGGSTSGCQGDCSNCTMKQSAAFTSEVFSSGGYLNLQAAPRIIMIGEEYPASFKEMNDVPEVAAKIQQFNDQVFQGQPVPPLIKQGNYFVAPVGYLIAMVDICGRATPLVIPETAMPNGGAGGAAASCSCTNGTCTLTERSVPFVGSVKYCEGNCSGTCTLSTSVAVGTGATYSTTGYDY